MTAGYHVSASCPACGGELLASETSEVLAPDHTTTEARCDVCLTLWRLDLTATCVEAWPVPRDPEAITDRARGRCADGPIGAALR